MVTIFCFWNLCGLDYGGVVVWVNIAAWPPRIVPSARGVIIHSIGSMGMTLLWLVHQNVLAPKLRRYQPCRKRVNKNINSLIIFCWGPQPSRCLSTRHPTTRLMQPQWWRHPLLTIDFTTMRGQGSNNSVTCVDEEDASSSSDVGKVNSNMKQELNATALTIRRRVKLVDNDKCIPGGWQG